MANEQTNPLRCLDEQDLKRIADWYQFLPLSLIDAGDTELLHKIENFLEGIWPAENNNGDKSRTSIEGEKPSS